MVNVKGHKVGEQNMEKKERCSNIKHCAGETGITALTQGMRQGEGREAGTKRLLRERFSLDVSHTHTMNLRRRHTARLFAG